MSIVGLVFMQSPASASHGDISVPLVTFILADEGEIVVLASVDVEEELVGDTCNWDFHSTNQESVHPGNDLILSTNGVDTIVPGVEDSPDQVLDVAGSFELGETVTVSLRMGPDKMFSAGLHVELVCEPDEAPATATTAPTATTAAPAISPAATTSTTTPAKAVVDTDVAGEVEIAETPAPAAPVVSAPAPALAVTGPSSFTGPLVAYAVLLLISGVAFLGLRTRASD